MGITICIGRVAVVVLIVGAGSTRYLEVMGARPAIRHRAASLTTKNRDACHGARLSRIMSDVVPELLRLLKSDSLDQFDIMLPVLPMHQNAVFWCIRRSTTRPFSGLIGPVRTPAWSH